MPQRNDVPPPTRTAAPAQPRPWERRDASAGRLNADVLEVIAEYACDTAADACALRGSCKGYRRAVDTTVRRLVYEDQPELRVSTVWVTPSAAWSGGARAALRTNCYSPHLDAVRIAFTCDGFPKIARLVVVAFGLDGAKDELHEWDACGPRPVISADDAMIHAGPQLNQSAFRSCWISARAPQSLARCLVDATVKAAALADEGWPATAEEAGHWRSMTRLAFDTHSATDPALHPRIVRLLTAVSAQLTHLLFHMVFEDMCPAVAQCTKLTHINVRSQPDPATSTALANALIMSGAPVEAVVVVLQPADAVRLLTKVPTITEAVTGAILRSSLPVSVVRRLKAFNFASDPVSMPYCEELIVTEARDWRPAAHATSISVERNEPLRIADIAAAYPKLREIRFADVAENIVIDEMSFPPSLTSIHMRTDSDALATQRLMARLGGHSPRCHLSEVVLRTVVDITPLVAVADSLKSLTMENERSSAALEAPLVSALEAALAALVELRRLVIPTLPTARCLLAGRHTRMRDLKVQLIDSDGARFRSLVAACPRLVFVRCDCVAQLAFDAPAGWSGTSGSTIGLLQRTSYRLI